MTVNILLATFMAASAFVQAQSDVYADFQRGLNLLNASNYAGAYQVFSTIEPKCSSADTLYDHYLFEYVRAAAYLERSYRNAQQFDSSLTVAIQALRLIHRDVELFGSRREAMRYLMLKNIVVAYVGREQYDSASKYREMLYDAYRKKQLPRDMAENFNFTFFKHDNKNIWGYEWYEDIPEDRMSKSFSKVVYYVYSTNEDGTDKEQLYRIHLLMFHKVDPTLNIDYVLTYKEGSGANEVSKTLYGFTYTKKIDYRQLQSDIVAVLNGRRERR